MPELTYEDREVRINDMPFRRVVGAKYRYNYYKLADKCAEKPEDELSWYREVIRTDLFFIVYFVLRIPSANHPFVIDACREVAEGPATRTLDLWAREHFKSTIITTAETIQKILNNPEETVAIFSYSRPIAEAFLRGIKQTLETSDLLKACFPDVLWTDPKTQAPKWSETAGLVVRRKGSQKEGTIEAWGLTEGMPTSKHYSHRIYDDIVTADLVNTPELIEKVKFNFDLSHSLGRDGGTHRVVGTTYHHEDPLVALKGRTTPEGESLYTVRVKPATVDGTYNGESVFLSEERLTELRANKRTFAAQQLLDPSPSELQKLDPKQLREIDIADVPSKLYKFICIDPAGQRKDRVGDSWAILVVGVEPYLREVGASSIYVLDAVIEPLTETEAIQNIVRLYLSHGRIEKVGVEKVSMMTAEVHIANALSLEGVILSTEDENLEILMPRGRKKEERIVDNLSWPLHNGKIFLTSSVPLAYRNRLKLEMQKFPFWKDDGLDALSYVVDMISSYKFGRHPDFQKKEEPWLKFKRRPAFNDLEGWMMQ